MVEAKQQDREMIQTVELVYAQALLELAKESEVLDEIADQMAQVAHLAQQQPDLVRLISTKTISTAQRTQIIENVFKGQVHDLLHRFFQVVNNKNRLDHLQGIAAALANLVDQDRGTVRVNAFVANELDKDRAEQVARRIGQIVNGQVELSQHVQPDLIGGLKVQIGDRMIDGSVAAQLRSIERKIVLIGRASARAQAETLVNDA